MTSTDRVPYPDAPHVRSALARFVAVLAVVGTAELVSLPFSAAALGASDVAAPPRADSPVLTVFVVAASLFLLFVAGLLVHLSRRFDVPNEKSPGATRP